MAKAIRIHSIGGADTMVFEDVDVGAPGPGQVRLRHTAIGLNFIDVYFRTGVYKVPELPVTLGMEGAGAIEAVGEGVDEFQVGDRVAYANPMGSYATERLAPADRLVRIPDGISDETAAAMMLKGMTAQYLTRRTFRVSEGHTILIHAAAGGVGLIVCQWASRIGATVIGTVGSEEKAALAKANGCHHTILYRSENVAERVKELTGGAGCDVVYDSVGAAMFPASLDCLRPLGLWALFGQSSGVVPPIDPGILAQKGSLFMTRPMLFGYTAKREDLVATANDLFDVVRNGTVKIDIGQRFPLAEAAAAHRALEARQTTGSTILLP
jgi:NADPH2:quinone reductase